MVVPLQSMVLYGPCDAKVRVKLMDREAWEGRKWIKPDCDPNVIVVECPVSSIFAGSKCKGEGEGFLHLHVAHGRLLITSSHFPWKCDDPPSDLKQSIDQARELGADASRIRARDSNSVEGWLEDEHGDRALSVRLTNRCPPHHAHMMEPRACGHTWCRLCDGFVDPITMNVLEGPGPIIKCNRYPRKLEKYDFLFKETFLWFM